MVITTNQTVWGSNLCGRAIALTGWLNRHQQAATGYLIEENRVLKDQLEGKGFGSPINSGSKRNRLWLHRVGWESDFPLKRCN